MCPALWLDLTFYCMYYMRKVNQTMTASHYNVAKLWNGWRVPDAETEADICFETGGRAVFVEQDGDWIGPDAMPGTGRHEVKWRRPLTRSCNMHLQHGLPACIITRRGEKDNSQSTKSLRGASPSQLWRP